ncbi:MAG: helix-turn-helix domain-containing protein, partial [Candidatus Aenigmarchaeota archaeon]|nr:helix-turn-helix domain-containing protein [Candidatus Aenigmarchaeota archaeon]
MKQVLVRALNRNQILILREIDGTETMTAFIRRAARIYGISESTLKANSRILKNLGMITFGNSSVAMLTDFGVFAL